MNHHGRGFTLLEVLVALTIFAVGVLVATRTIGSVTNSVAGLEDRQLGNWSAQNHLAELRLAGAFPSPGVAETEVTQGGRQFQLRTEVSGTPNPLFRRVDIQVFAREQKRLVARLSGLVVQRTQ